MAARPFCGTPPLVSAARHWLGTLVGPTDCLRTAPPGSQRSRLKEAKAGGCATAAFVFVRRAPHPTGRRREEARARVVWTAPEGSEPASSCDDQEESRAEEKDHKSNKM